MNRIWGWLKSSAAVCRFFKEKAVATTPTHIKLAGEGMYLFSLHSSYNIITESC
jgi:hypothetical protein